MTGPARLSRCATLAGADRAAHRRARPPVRRPLRLCLGVPRRATGRHPRHSRGCRSRLHRASSSSTRTGRRRRCGPWRTRSTTRILLRSQVDLRPDRPACREYEIVETDYGFEAGDDRRHQQSAAGTPDYRLGCSDDKAAHAQQVVPPVLPPARHLSILQASATSSSTARRRSTTAPSAWRQILYATIRKRTARPRPRSPGTRRSSARTATSSRRPTSTRPST